MSDHEAELPEKPPISIWKRLCAGVALFVLAPFDGKPLRYKKAAHGVIVYSVGEDGVDNGGNIDLFWTGATRGRIWGFNYGTSSIGGSRRRNRNDGTPHDHPRSRRHS